MMRRAAAILALSFSIAPFWIGAACAQNPFLPSAAGTEAPPSGAPAWSAEKAFAQPEVILIGDLAVRMQELDRSLRFIRSNSHATARGFRKLQTEIGAYLTEVDQLREDPEFEIRPELTSAAVDSIDEVWRDAAAKLREWERVLSRRASETEAILASLRRSKELFGRTGERTEEPLPSALAVRLERALADIAVTEALVRERRDTVLLLQDRVAEQLLYVSELEQRADEAAESFRRSLWITDGPRLWRVIREQAPATSSWEQIREASAAQRGSLKRFALANRDRIVLHVMLYLAIVAGLLVLRRGAGSWPTDDASLMAFTKTLNRPWASGTLVALAATPWIYPRGPLAVLKVVGVLITVAILRVLTGLLTARLRVALYALVALFAVGNVSDLLAVDAPLRRILLLALQLLGLAALAMTIRVSRRSAGLPELHRGWWKTVQFGALAGFAVLTGALAANVAGKVLLTSTWTHAVIRSTLLAVAGASVALVLEGIWAALLRSRTANALNAVRRHGDLLRSRGTWFVRIGIPLLWITATLHMYQFLLPVQVALTAALSATLKIRGFEISAGAIFESVLVLLSTVLLLRVTRFFLDEDVFPRTNLDRGLSTTISQTIHYAVVLVGFFAALAAAGIELSKFTVLAGAFGVGLAFGMQNIVNNFISGLILLYERPIKIGDTIDVGGASGEVTRIGVRSSTVATWEGAEIIVPNADLITKEVVNWTLTDQRRRLDLPVGVAYGTDPSGVIDLLARTASNHPDVLKDPAPRALFLGFGESSLNFSLRFWTVHFDAFAQVRSDVGIRVCAALVNAGIAVPFPQRDVNLRTIGDNIRETPGGGGTGS